MNRSNTIITNFTAGELSPKLLGRVDLAKYYNGCKQTKNSIIMMHGGTIRRPGTYFVSFAKYANKKIRLVSFQSSLNNSYIIEFGDKYARFYMNEGQIITTFSNWVTSTAYDVGSLVTNGTFDYRCIVSHTSGTFATDLSSGNWEACSPTSGQTDTAYEIPTPYLEAELMDIGFEQSIDVLYIAHNLHPPSKISRMSHTDWNYEVIPFTYKSLYIIDYMYGPPKDITNITNSISPEVLVIDHGLSEDDKILFRDIIGMNELNGKKRTITTVIDANTLGFSGDTSAYDPYESGGNISLIVNGKGITKANPGVVHRPSHGLKTGDIVYFEGVLGMTELNDTEQTVTVIDSNFFSICDTSTFSAYTSGGTVTKREFHGTGNYPSCVAFFEERLAWAGSLNRPQTLWFSVSGDYENLTTGEKADEAIITSINADMLNAIRWMLPKEFMFIGTSSGVWKIPSDNSTPLTPTNKSTKRFTTMGSNSVQGMLLNNEGVFVQLGGLKVRELTYDFRRDDYITPDLTILSDHITIGEEDGDSGIICWDYQQSPDSILWAIRRDGCLIALTMEKDQDVAGWHPHYTCGNDVFESVAIIPKVEEDQIWLSTIRTLGGATVRCIEYMAPRIVYGGLEDYFYVDCGLTYSGSPASVISGLDHLEGETVAVIGDGNDLGDQLVENGSVILSVDCSKVHVGKSTEWLISPVRLDMPSSVGSSQGQNKKIDHITVRFYNTHSCNVGPTEEDQDPVIFDAEDGELFTGDIRMGFDGPVSRDGDIVLTNNRPSPVSILAIIIEGTLYERNSDI